MEFRLEPGRRFNSGRHQGGSDGPVPVPEEFSDAQATACSAFMIVSVTAWGCEIMITCDPSTSAIWALARWAMERTTSAPATLSPVATTAQEGRFFHAAGPFFSPKAAAATGRWAAHKMAASFFREIAGEGVVERRRVDGQLGFGLAT